MTLNVLQTRGQIAAARKHIVGQGLSALESPLGRLARSLGLKRGMVVGDSLKSWDVDATLSFLQANVSKDSPIADFGCFASEILVALHKAGYQDLTGVDLNKRLRQMPFSERIRYEVSDFTKTPFDPETFSAITAISVIEHGYNPQKLLSEVSRLLKVGGYFIASFDYWPEKIQTGDIQFFGMPWLIFSREDVRDLIAVSGGHGLIPVGDLVFEARDRPIQCGGKKYTFAHLVLQKHR
jgi:SAM-dependent methyltransferase